MDFRAFYLRCRFWINDFLQGSPIRTQYNEIKLITESSYEKGNIIRLRNLQKLLIHAKKNTCFYKDYSLDLTDYPIMNKNLYRDNYDKINVQSKNIPFQKGVVHIQKTSGSTGTPFSIPQDTRKRQRRIAELKYFGKIVGFNSHEKLIHLRTWNNWQSKTTKQIKLENIIPFDISCMGVDKMCELSSLINNEKAICIRAYASTIDLFAKYVKKHNELNFPSLKIIIAGSETLHDDTRGDVINYLGCNIISQYANEECGILAQERICSEDNVMYLNNASYIFEFLKIDSDIPAEYGELARIVITDLNNYAFPIIRYDTGDVGTLLPPNKYSNGYPVLGKLYGRRFDVCYTVNNEPFSPMALGRTFKNLNGILQWQFIQIAEAEYIIKIIKDESNDLDIDSMILYIKDIVGEIAKIKLEFVNEIPVLASGKRKMVVNQWKK